MVDNANEPAFAVTLRFWLVSGLEARTRLVQPAVVLAPPGLNFAPNGFKVGSLTFW